MERGRTERRAVLVLRSAARAAGLRTKVGAGYSEAVYSSRRVVASGAMVLDERIQLLNRVETSQFVYLICTSIRVFTRFHPFLIVLFTHVSATFQTRCMFKSSSAPDRKEPRFYGALLLTERRELTSARPSENPDDASAPAGRPDSHLQSPAFLKGVWSGWTRR
jgi:hypothetical protein